jgi:alcohol dehydrogenase class IV
MAATALNELRKFVAPEFVFGVDARRLAGRYAHRLGGRRILLVSGPQVAAAGWTGETEHLLGEAGFQVIRFSGFTPNPRDHQVMVGSRLYLDESCDLIVAVGGGSAMDCAKGIGIVAANGGSVLDYEGVDQVPAPMPPLICIPTTCGSSADVSQFAIFTDSQERRKAAIVSKAVVPDVALIDPATLVTLDRQYTACTGLDALAHAMEAFVSNAHSPITDLHALEAIRLLRANLLDCLEAPLDLERRCAVMLASLHAGLAFSNASLGCTHALAHSLGGMLDLPHGECNALLLTAVVEFNFPAAPERYRRVAGAFGLADGGLDDEAFCRQLVAELKGFCERCGIIPGLTSRGVRRSDLPSLAVKALRDPCNATNPRNPGLGDLESLYTEAM